MRSRLSLFPITTTLAATTAHTAATDSMTINGCDVAQLAAEFGTPLYLFDEATLDDAVAQYRSALATYYPAPSAITLAGKALLFTASVQWTAHAGLWLDCTGAGEIYVARNAGMPRARILVHGVNKSVEDLDAAFAESAVIVVDNLPELDRILARIAAAVLDSAPEIQPEIQPEIWLRVRPGIAVDTHAYRQTGQADSKFGMSSDEILTAVRRCLAAGVRPQGIHFHQGSHFHDVAPIGPGLAAVLDVIAILRDSLGWTPTHLSPGGGWGVPYHEEDLPHATIEDYVRFVATQLVQGCAQRNLPLPMLHVEPGRSLVARAGVAVYGVGAVKQSAARHWLLIDGGMADNPRPALYGAHYSALPVRDPLRAAAGVASIAGPYCESGDVLIYDLPMADVQEGELIAIPVSGAYHLNMQSNYNGARKPAVLWLRDGQAHLVQRRETPADLLARDLPLPIEIEVALVPATPEETVA